MKLSETERKARKAASARARRANKEAYSEYMCDYYRLLCANCNAIEKFEAGV